MINFKNRMILPLENELKDMSAHLNARQLNWNFLCKKREKPQKSTKIVKHK